MPSKGRLELTEIAEFSGFRHSRGWSATLKNEPGREIFRECYLVKDEAIELAAPFYK